MKALGYRLNEINISEILHGPVTSTQIAPNYLAGRNEILT